VPLDWRRVEEAPIVESPVPPCPRARALVRMRVPILAWPEVVKAVVEAYGKTEATVEVALNLPRVSCSELEPVRVVPFDP
jgi:hypothetical protein